MPGKERLKPAPREVAVKPKTLGREQPARLPAGTRRINGEVYHFDPHRLQPVSKIIDADYVAAKPITPPISEIRQPVSVRIWHDAACAGKMRRRTSALQINFAGAAARTIDKPLLADEMVLFDSRRIYLDTSIMLQHHDKDVLAQVIQRNAEAIRAAAEAPVDSRYRNDILMISHHEGGGTWGHYLIQSIPRMLLFLEAFPHGKIALPAWHAKGVNGFGEVLEFYDIPVERLAPVESSILYPMKQAVLLDFLFDFVSGSPHPKALAYLQRPLPELDIRKKTRKGAFIKRRTDSQRAIENESTVDEVMSRHGIDTFGPGELSLSKQIRIWQSYDLLVATLGSDLSNIVYARPGTRVLVISPHWFGDAFFFELSVAAGVHWYELRCGEMTWRNEEERFSNFLVDTALLDSVLSSLLAELPMSATAAIPHLSPRQEARKRQRTERSAR